MSSEEIEEKMDTNKHLSPEMVRFNDTLRQAMQVSKADLNRMLAEEKVAHKVRQKPGRKPKTSTSSPASPDKG